MSNRPNRSRRPGPAPASPPAGRRRVLLLVGAAVLVVVVIGVLLALGGADDDSATTGDRPDFGPVAVEGATLPELADGGPDSAVGTPAPVIEAMDPEGSGVTYGNAGEEPSLLVFLAHWCPHCQAEVPVIVDLIEAGELDGVRTVAILTGTDPSLPNHPPMAWLEREGWTGEVALDDEQSTAARAYGLPSYPFLVFLDADGSVVARRSGEIPAEELIAQIAALRPAG